ncbi:hypothetical protein PsorP6_003567 [Peronosclerospora sorghi]|uniref:Uncharacterized protein n=1 Tax=Peronosclerospora sorghi TaxID=230839 RepID=A0ACC0VKF3_9STRA|nr:hypothetical protein PsorP6_003567 [Peronosclerospora sorghi]
MAAIRSSDISTNLMWHTHYKEGFNHSANDEIVRAIAARKLLKANDVTNDEDRMTSIVSSVKNILKNESDVDALKSILSRTSRT